MTTITANMVKELRERSGAGMMECKKALNETNGDIEAALDALRASGQAKAAKRAGKIAAEGAIVIRLDDQQQNACIIEVNCETDFVARSEQFLEFAQNSGRARIAGRSENCRGIITIADGRWHTDD